jgi:hypothetical protein
MKTIPFLWSFAKHLFVLVIGLILIYLFPVTFKDGLNQYQSKSWPSVNGLITAVNLDYYQHDSFYKGQVRNIKLEFKYVVGGKTYTKSIERSSGRRGDIDLEWLQYSLGQEVNVFYNPQEHTLAFLDHQTKVSILSVLWPPLFCLVAGLLLTVMFFYKCIEQMKARHKAQT